MIKVLFLTPSKAPIQLEGGRAGVRSPLLFWKGKENKYSVNEIIVESVFHFVL